MADEASQDPKVEESQVEEPEPTDVAQSEPVVDPEPEEPEAHPDETKVMVAGKDQEFSPEELEEARANEVAFSWEASEYVHNVKGPGWYVALFGILVALMAVSALLHAWLEIGLFVVMGGAILVYARKPPRTLLYELTPKGITIDGKEIPFSQLRSFGVLEEEEWHTIDLDPTRRFSPRISILFGSNDFDSVVGHLELHLPRADRDPDLIERATRYLRF